MIRCAPVGILLWLALACAGAPAPASNPAVAPSGDVPAKSLLLAFYHPWYGTPWGPTGKWKQWTSFKFPDRYHPEKIIDGWRHEIASGDYPLIGPYDTSDP